MPKKVALSSTGSKSGIVADQNKKRQIKAKVSNQRNDLLEISLNKAQSIASLGSWEMSGKFLETYWSDEFYRIHGLEPQSVKPSAKLRLSVVHPNDRMKLQKAIDGAIKDGKPFSIEKRIIRPDKEIRWVLSQGEVSVDKATGKRKVFGTILDITDRKLQEIKQAEIEESLRRVQAIAGIGSWEISGEFLETHWSDEFYRIHGLEPQSVKASTKLRLSMVHFRDRQKLQTAIEGAIKNGKPFSLEKRIIRPDKEIRWVLSQGEVSVDKATGKRKVFGTILDITDRKLQEIKQAEIEESLRRVQAIAGIGSFAVIGNDEEVYWSDEFYHIHGLKPGSVKPSTKLRFEMVHPHDRKKIKDAIFNTLKTGKPYLVEKRIVQPSGQIRWVRSQGESSIDPITGKQKLAGTLLDITELKTKIF